MFNICWFLLLEALFILQITARPPKTTCSVELETLKCTGDIPRDPNQTTTLALELHNLKDKVLDMKRIAETFPLLQSLTVYDSNITEIVPPHERNYIKMLRLRKLLISNLSSNFLLHFPSLEIVHLEENHLKYLPRNFELNNVKELYLRDNKWNCSENLEWVLNLEKEAAKDVENLTCFGVPYQGKHLLSVAEYLKDLKKTCNRECDCTLEKIVTEISSSYSEPLIMVNCSYRGLTELPSHLPNYTRILYVEGNSITDLDPLKNNPHYKSVWDLYLDDNQIATIGVLEGSYWLSHFRTLSLRGNKLTKLPSYALDNALSKNPQMPITRIYLGGNPWRCDCVFTPVFQELVLRKYAAQVRDTHDVKCSNVEGDENARSLIVELTRSSVCRVPTEYSLQEGLDLLNAVLASLIIFILGKLAYDYYHFKRTGKLPWIIMKMP